MKSLRTYVDKKGGLIVEKRDTLKDETAILQDDVSVMRSASPVKKENVEVNASDMVEAMQSYTSSFAVNDSSSKGECVICGKPTAFKNRKVCVDCWKEHKDKIMNEIVSLLNGKTFKV